MPSVAPPLAYFPDPENPARWLCFDRPLAAWRADSPAEVAAAVARAESRARKGDFVAGLVCSEAAAALNPDLPARAPDSVLPLAWFAAFAAPAPRRCRGRARRRLCFGANSTVDFALSSSRRGRFDSGSNRRRADLSSQFHIFFAGAFLRIAAGVDARFGGASAVAERGVFARRRLGGVFGFARIVFSRRKRNRLLPTDERHPRPGRGRLGGARRFGQRPRRKSDDCRYAAQRFVALAGRARGGGARIAANRIVSDRGANGLDRARPLARRAFGFAGGVVSVRVGDGRAETRGDANHRRFGARAARRLLRRDRDFARAPGAL